MAWRYPSRLVPLGMSNLLHNRNEAKANIQMQKTGENALIMPTPLPAFDLEH